MRCWGCQTAMRVCMSGTSGCSGTRSSRIIACRFSPPKSSRSSPPVPLALHNYTTFANILAFPFIPLLGVVRTFNVLVLCERRHERLRNVFLRAQSRPATPWRRGWAGCSFGFSPFMSARAAEHFSLTLAAPLPIFGWLMYRIAAQPTLGLACAAGATVAWAFLCDVYYAVYCLLWAGFMACYTHDQRRNAAGARAARVAARARRPRDRLSRRAHRRHPASRRRSGRPSSGFASASRGCIRRCSC